MRIGYLSLLFVIVLGLALDLGSLGNGSVFVLIVIVVGRSSLLRLRLALAGSRSSGRSTSSSGGRVDSFLLQLGEALTNRLHSLAHLSSDVFPVGDDLGQTDNRKKKLATLGVVPGSHFDVFMMVEGR